MREHNVELRKHVDEMSVEGLRTLLLAERRVDREEFLVWKEKYEIAKNMIEGRTQKIEELQDEIERGLLIVGATAIEDKLQDQVRKKESPSRNHQPTEKSRHQSVGAYWRQGRDCQNHWILLLVAQRRDETF